MSMLDAVRAISHGPLLSDSALASESGQSELADAYFDLPYFDRDDSRAWDAMSREVWRQRGQLVDIGLKFEVTDEDPYASPREMFADVENGRIRVLSTATTGHHPYWCDATNDAFRAVHDVFGHFAAQRGFDRHGEEAAYRRHSLMFSPLAAMAMATETRGQNAAYVARGKFQSERIAILPAPYRDPYFLTPTGPSEWRRSREASDYYHRTRVA